MMYGYGWGWMLLMPLLWIGLLAVVIWAVVKITQSTIGREHRPAEYGPPQRETPEEILDRRFASGEIDADAYSEARAQLAAARESGSS